MDIELCGCGHLKHFHKYTNYKVKKRKTRAYCKLCDCMEFKEVKQNK